MKQETLPLHKYLIQVQKPSEIIKGLMIDDEENYLLVCPRCGEKQARIEHGGTRKCVTCGLKMTVYGNSLRIEA